jgi:hypothetical protein
MPDLKRRSGDYTKGQVAAKGNLKVSEGEEGDALEFIPWAAGENPFQISEEPTEISLERFYQIVKDRLKWGRQTSDA